MKKVVLRKRNERGFTIVAFALMIFTMLGFAGLAVDVGYLQLEKRKLQAAADAGAMGALREMEKGNAPNSSDVIARGQNDSSLNGFTDGQHNTTVTIATPASGAYANDPAAIAATVTRVVPTFFMRVLGTSSVTITATAVAKTPTSQGSIGGCIFVMEQESPSFKVNGTPSLSTACGIMVNSSNPQAMTMDGVSQIVLSSGAKVGVVGQGTAGSGWYLQNSNNIVTDTGTSQSPVNVQAFADPLASVTPPTPSGLLVRTPPGSSSGYTVKSNTAETLNPGIYCGGISVQGNATFNTGTYILAGGGMQGGLQIGAQGTMNDTGIGEMFYNTTENSQAWGCPGSSSAGFFKLAGGGNINLIGLTVPDPNYTGGTIGMLFFDDRGVSNLKHKIVGTSTSTFDGAMYFLNSDLQFAGTNKTPGFLYIVANTLGIAGTTNLGNDKSSLSTVNILAPTSTGSGLVQ